MLSEQNDVMLDATSGLPVAGKFYSQTVHQN